MTQAYFITLEGVEGVGKSTALQFIDALLTKRGVPHRLTREPGGTALAEAIRDVILNAHDSEMDARTELLLFFASRVQHVAELIAPVLKAGETVVSDRFTDASYAYQGAGRGIPMESIATLEAACLSGLSPDLTLLLDAPPAICTQRLEQRNQHKDRIESEDASFFKRIRDAYLVRAAQFPDRIKVIDASGSFEEVQAQITTCINELLK